MEGLLLIYDKLIGYLEKQGVVMIEATVVPLMITCTSCGNDSSAYSRAEGAGDRLRPYGLYASRQGATPRCMWSSATKRLRALICTR